MGGQDLADVVDGAGRQTHIAGALQRAGTVEDAAGTGAEAVAIDAQITQAVDIHTTG